jgi:nucleotide-binding universal stress UspA family protein
MSIRRILVAVDSSPLSLAAAEAACALAGRLGAKLDALFIEDINVVRLAAHPHVHTFSLAAARRSVMDDGLIEKALELQIVAARRGLEAILAANGARGEFAVRRGRVDIEVLAATLSADLICLGWSGRAVPGLRPRLGSVARTVAAQAGRPVLVAQRRAMGPLMVWWDGSPGALRAMDLAVELTGHDGGIIDLLVPADDGSDGPRLAVEAVEMLEERGLIARIRAIGRIPRMLAAMPADGLLLIAADSALALADAPCSVLVAR